MCMRACGRAGVHAYIPVSFTDGVNSWQAARNSITIDCIRLFVEQRFVGKENHINLNPLQMLSFQREITGNCH